MGEIDFEKKRLKHLWEECVLCVSKRGFSGGSVQSCCLHATD